MATPLPYAYSRGRVRPIGEAVVPIAAAAALYGLSVYTVALLRRRGDAMLCFRLPEHHARLRASAHLIGMRTLADRYPLDVVRDALAAVVRRTRPTEDVFARITIHAMDEIPGVRTADVALDLSIFLYPAAPILPPAGARIKTSLWRRTRDDAIPARAKVNGAYVNSCLAKQDALDAGCDDALFLSHDGFVSELTAANIFLVRDGTLITPHEASDILEGITRRTILEEARAAGIPTVERAVALTELYTADEVFACGTSAGVTPILAVDGREISAAAGARTRWAQSRLVALQSDPESPHVTAFPLDADAAGK